MSQQLARLSSSGQITLPKAFREAIGLMKGDTATIDLTEEGILIKRQKSFEELEAEMRKMREGFSEKTKKLIRENEGKTARELRKEIDDSPEGVTYYARKYSPDSDEENDE